MPKQASKYTPKQIQTILENESFIAKQLWAILGSLIGIIVGLIIFIFMGLNDSVERNTASYNNLDKRLIKIEVILESIDKKIGDH